MMRFLMYICMFSALAIDAQVVHDYVVSEMDGEILLHDGSTTTVWGFGKYNTGEPVVITTPGPILRYQTGDSVVVHFLNNSEDKHTIHLHGLDANQDNDGVPFTSFSVLSGDSTTYSFNALHPGVYLYHCHVATVFHLAMGMYGMLVIDYPDSFMFNGGPGYNKEYLYLSSDMDRSWNDNPNSPGLFYKYKPDQFLINGKEQDQLFTDSTEIILTEIGDNILLRLAHIGYTVVEYNFPTEINPTIYMSDGRILPTPLQLNQLRVYPGERYSILLQPTEQISDYIMVNVRDLKDDSLLGTNYIGINANESPVQVEELIKPTFTVYPNPNSGAVTIKKIGEAPITVQLFDINGKSIHQYQLTKEINTLDMSQLKNGIYLLKSENGFSEKIIRR